MGSPHVLQRFVRLVMVIFSCGVMDRLYRDGRLAMEPTIEVNIDDDGMVTVTVVDSDGKRGKLEMPLEVAETLKGKLVSRTRRLPQSKRVALTRRLVPSA